MADRDDVPAEAVPTLVWERPEPPPRSAPSPLSRDRIVAAAIDLADTDGLAVVSVRKVAAELDAGPMRLYRYLTTKGELLDLMVDAVFAEVALPARVGADWRTPLRALAWETRAAALRHEWFVDLLGGRPYLGPHALAYTEAAMAALDGAPGFATIDATLRAFGVFNAYLGGALRGEVTDLRAERATGMTEPQWHEASSGYLRRMLDTGRFPTLAKVVADADHPDNDTVFGHGLEMLLDGLGGTAR